MELNRQSHDGSSAITLTSRNLPIDTITRDRLALVVRKNLQDVLREFKHGPLPLQGLITYEIHDQKYVVDFLVQWVKHMNVSESLSVCVLEEHDYQILSLFRLDFEVPDVLIVFHRVINHFSNMTMYNSDLYDSMIDWYIIYLRNNYTNLDNIFKMCLHNDVVSKGGLVRVCANVLVHHGKSLFTPENEERFQWWLQNHIEEEAKAKIPGDIMSPAFADHCAYHHHTNDEICYKQKISGNSQQAANMAYALPLR
ncbi:hypothetical protein KCU65_g5154, partial [Aureobasidium melanogenum]